VDLEIPLEFQCIGKGIPPDFQFLIQTFPKSVVGYLRRLVRCSCCVPYLCAPSWHYPTIAEGGSRR
jgi:hypothetical protein